MSFRKAERKKAKLRLGIFGPSGSGKTYSALLIAKGLGGKTALIDTEAGSGELYSHLMEYDVDFISKPFTPKKYYQKIQEAVNAGYDNIIVDSLTHAWSGEGGMLEMKDMIAKQSRNKNSYMAWRDITPEHNKLVNSILTSPAHLIVTVRTKTAYELQTGDNGKIKPVKVGLAPVFRDGIEYEFTVCLDIEVDSHVASSSKDRTTLFDGEVFVPSEDTGKKLIEWLDSGAEPIPLSPEPIENKQTGEIVFKDINGDHHTSEEDLARVISGQMTNAVDLVRLKKIASFAKQISRDEIKETLKEIYNEEKSRLEKSEAEEKGKKDE